MKIFELVKSAPAITAPGNVVAPVGPGVRPSGSQPIPNTEQKPNTSNTPNILQPNAQGALAQPMGQNTSQPVSNQNQQDQDETQLPQSQQPTQQPATDALTSQDFKTQMQALMMKLQQIQGQEPPPASTNPQPGVSG
jgi:hypothetical protein